MSLSMLQKMNNTSHTELSGVLETYSVSAQLIDAVSNERSFQRKYARGESSIVIQFERGELIGFYGAVIDGLEFHTCEEGIAHLMASGCSYEDTLNQIRRDLLSKLTTFPPQTAFQPDQSDLGRPLPLPIKMGEELAGLLRANQVEEEMLRLYGLALTENILWTELSFDIAKSRLSLQLLKDYRKMYGSKTIGQALDIDNRVTDMWRSFDIFIEMGFVSMKTSSVFVNDEPVDLERVEELEATLERLKSQPAYVVFELTAPNEVNDKHIDQVFRTLSKAHHPDRFGKVSVMEKDLIVEVYSQINDLHMELQDEDLRTELKKRLDVERRGLQYVSDEDEKKAELLQAQGTFFFRKKRYTEALEMLDKAFEINPYNWRTNTMRVRCQVELEQISKKEAAEILAGNKDARGSDRVELLFQAGQYYYKDGEQAEAYELFRKVVELDDGHIDAKRYLHLRKRQSKTQVEEDADTKSSFFSRLFSKK